MIIDAIIAASATIVAAIAKLILQHGGTEADLARLKLSNATEIDRIIAAESAIVAKIKAEIAKKPAAT